MNKLELIEKISIDNNITKKDTTTIINAFIDSIIEDLDNGNKVTISNFGTFSKSKVKAHDLFNPKTGETIHVPESYRINFKPSKK